MNKRFKTLALLLSAFSMTTFVPIRKAVTTCAKGGEKHHWTIHEDKQLKALVKKFGYRWGTISQNMPGVSTRQCRERYVFILSPSINRDDFTKEEDENLLNLVYENGKRWVFLANQYFPGKTGYMVRNRYNSLVKKQNKERFAKEWDEKVKKSSEPKVNQSEQSGEGLLGEELFGEGLFGEELFGEKLFGGENSKNVNQAELSDDVQPSARSSFLKIESGSDFDDGLFEKFFW